MSLPEDQHECYYCGTRSPIVECAGIYHCANLLCQGPGAAWFRHKLKSYKDTGKGHTVDIEEWQTEAEQYYLKEGREKGYTLGGAKLCTDKEWIARVRLIKDPVEMLKTIVENENFLGYDSYYSDLRKAMLETAQGIINTHKST